MCRQRPTIRPRGEEYESNVLPNLDAQQTAGEQAKAANEKRFAKAEELLERARMRRWILERLDPEGQTVEHLAGRASIHAYEIEREVAALVDEGLVVPSSMHYGWTANVVHFRLTPAGQTELERLRRSEEESA